MGRVTGQERPGFYFGHADWNPDCGRSGCAVRACQIARRCLVQLIIYLVKASRRSSALISIQCGTSPDDTRTADPSLKFQSVLPVTLIRRQTVRCTFNSRKK